MNGTLSPSTAPLGIIGVALGGVVADIATTIESAESESLDFFMAIPWLLLLLPLLGLVFLALLLALLTVTESALVTAAIILPLVPLLVLLALLPPPLLELPCCGNCNCGCD